MIALTFTVRYICFIVCVGDAFSYQNGMSFTTKNRDNDKDNSQCAKSKVGAWLYDGCALSNLNGKYLHKRHQLWQGLYWEKWKASTYSLKATAMMVRRASH